MFRYLTAGESHGPGLSTIVEGVPAGLPLLAEHIDRDLARRQGGYGRGRRQKIETDRIEILSGVRHGVTLGGPIAMHLPNRDYQNRKQQMQVEPLADEEAARLAPERVTKPRPGHADLTGALKYAHRDLRNVLERASARETAARVAVGGVAKRLLDEFGIQVVSHIVMLGGIWAELPEAPIAELAAAAEASEVRCADPEASRRMMAAVDAAKKDGDTLGGVFEVLVAGVPPGLGSHVHWDRKLDAAIARAVMSIQAIKGVEIGLGFRAAERPGSQVHDPIAYRPFGADPAGAGDFGSNRPGFYRLRNNAGGFEGGITTGEAIVVRGAMKPISTLYKPLPSVDFLSKEPFPASIERSDTCALPAAGVVGEAVVAIEVAAAFLDKFGGDSVSEIRRNFEGYARALREV